MHKKKLHTLLLIFISTQLFSQNLNIPLHSNFNRQLQSELNKTPNTIHSSFFPLNENSFSGTFNPDSLLYGHNRDSLFLENRKWKTLWRKIRTENLVDIQEDDYRIIFNPLFNFSLDRDLNSNTWLNNGLFSTNTRGVEIKGNIGKKVSFYTNFYENQAFFVDYLDEFARKQLVVPGQGTRKNFGEAGHDYAIVSGYLSFSPADFVNIQLGHGKNFIGNGYRSLLLSDNAIVTPYLKFSFKFKKFQYISLLTQNQAYYTNWVLDYHYRNGGSYNYISYIPHKRIEISLFEGLISQISDSTSLTNYNVNYFNPVIFSRTAQYGLNNENNIILGLNAKIKVSNQIQVYGQFMLDNLALSEENKPANARYGYQVGAKVFNALSFFKQLEKHNLYLQAEYNIVTPFSYTSHHAWQNYSHLNQSLAHPLGANFSEMLGILEYTYRDFSLELKYNYATKGFDYNGYNFGGDIFTINNFVIPSEISDSYTTEVGQGLETIIQNKTVKMSFLLNTRTNLRIFSELHIRSLENTTIKTESKYISIGIKTNLRNFYYDF